jgi:aryl sulfotransferase
MPDKPFFWLASYPKSGNTWMRLALASLRCGGNDIDINNFGQPDEVIASHRGAFDEALGIDSADLTEAEILAARPDAYLAIAGLLRETVVWKVHEAYIDVAPGRPLFPSEVTVGAIYIVRDPRDVAVSFADFAKIDIDAAIARMGDPTNTLSRQRARGINLLPQPLLDWSSHVVSWLDQPRFPVTTIRYEDMLADPVATLRRVAATVGFDVSDRTLSGVVAATRFEVLRGQEEAGGFAEKMPRQARFFRRGVSGGWRDVLTRRQAAQIEADHGAVMARLGYR